MENKREIGIHLRIQDSYSKLLEKAHQVDAKACQFFFLSPVFYRYVNLTPSDKEKFLELSKKNFSNIYGHCSYWINAVTGNEESSRISKKLLSKEIEIAKKLGIKHLVMHAGSAKDFPKDNDDPTNKNRGIDAMAKILNEVLENEKEVTVLIENTAHDGKAVCSDLEDFVLLRKKILPSIPVGFCFDTSHAFAYGYELKKTENFIDLLEETMGIKNIKLLHLNDSAKKCGSRIDEHAAPGRGLIGKKVLKKLVNHPKLKNLPIILELPPLPEEEVVEVITEIKNWEQHG